MIPNSNKEIIKDSEFKDTFSVTLETKSILRHVIKDIHKKEIISGIRISRLDKIPPRFYHDWLKFLHFTMING